MKPSTLEWINKAEADYVAGLTLARKRKIPLHDAACFHFQQSAEKYLKARIEEEGFRVPRTHDLDALLSVLLQVEPLWAGFRISLLRLSDYAVQFRYPGHEAAPEDVKQAKRDAVIVRDAVRRAFGLPV
jgi:HEPN domain-containing protein